MFTKRLISIIVVLVMVLGTTTGVLAAWNDISFDDYPLTIVEYRSPLATYARVNSVWQEPRSSGTSPHQGVDLQANEGDKLYAPFDGWVVHLANSTTTGNYNIRFMVDVNSDKVQNDGDYNIVFYHLQSRKTAGYYKKDDEIGTTGNEGSSSSGPHLHFGNYLNTGSKWVRNEPNYRHLASTSWNSGKDLDAYSTVTWNNNTISFAANYRDDKCDASTFSEVLLYYRTTSGGTWTSAGTLTGTGTTALKTYTYNFTGKVSSGTSVQWMFRLTRSGVRQTAFGKAKFAQPLADPNSTSEAYAYWTNTVT